MAPDLPLRRYVLKPADERELREQSKALHAMQQSQMGGSAYGGGGGGGGGPPPSPASRPPRVKVDHSAGASPGPSPLTPAATFAVARMESVLAVSPPRRKERPTISLLSMRRVEREVEAATRRLAASESGDFIESLTQAASTRRAAAEEVRSPLMAADGGRCPLAFQARPLPQPHE